MNMSINSFHKTTYKILNRINKYCKSFFCQQSLMWEIIFLTFFLWCYWQCSHSITSLPFILICPAHLSSNSKYIVLNSFSFISMCFTVPICPLINRSSMLMLVVNITLALSFNASNDARSPVSNCFRFCASFISQILEFLGTSSFAGIVISCPGMCFN